MWFENDHILQASKQNSKLVEKKKILEGLKTIRLYLQGLKIK